MDSIRSARFERECRLDRSIDIEIEESMKRGWKEWSRSRLRRRRRRRQVFNSLIGIFLINGYTGPRGIPVACPLDGSKEGSTTGFSPQRPRLSSTQCITITRVWRSDEMWRREIDSNILLFRARNQVSSTLILRIYIYIGAYNI